jgi:hypothetical protein
MSTIIPNIFSINGVIDTDRTVLQNLETLCSASGCWLSYDISQGKWAVVINKNGTSVASFNDSNILGGITISNTGLSELYNSAEIEFPHKDIKDRIDFINLSIDPNLRNPNEIDNVLKIQLDCVNDPIQAAYIAARELKQSRIDKVIQFRVDYSYLGLKAGELITVTNTPLGFTNKIFRIVKIEEEDDDDGVLSLSITGLEYDPDVYSTVGLAREDRFIDNGIIPEEKNEAIQASNDADISASLNRLLAASALTGLVNLLFQRNPLTGVIEAILKPADDKREKLLMNVKEPPITISGPNDICEGGTIPFVLSIPESCECSFDSENYEFDYEITGVSASDITIPLKGKTKIGAFPVPISSDGVIEGSETLTLKVGDATKNVIINDRLGFTYTTSVDKTSINEGESVVVTLTTNNVPDGTSIPYAITGTAVSKITSPLSGSVNIAADVASITVNTVDDNTRTGTQSFTVTFNGDIPDPCNELDRSVSVSVLDNTPAPPPDTTCVTVSIPLVWCPTYDGTTGQVKSMSVAKSIIVPAPVTGRDTITVPTAISVIPGNPSIINVTSTTQVDVGTGRAGTDYNVITSFNNIAPNGAVTGTTVTVRGY